MSSTLSDVPTPAAPPTAGSFTADLRAEYDDLFEAFWNHPFLRGLYDGTLPRECVQHYVEQDHQYLSSFVRCYGLGVSMSPDRDWMRWFNEQIAFVLNDEQHPHRVLCEAVGLDHAAVVHADLAPSAQAYVDHMALCARDSLGVLLSALLPCVWTYMEAATRALAAAEPPAADNPFRGWWEFYATDECQAILADFRFRVDLLADQAGPAERSRMAEAFRLGLHHEVRFWQMAWTREDWTPPRG